MAKDFAFQFCPGDYLRDTQCLSEKSQVAYDRIMCEHIRNVSNDAESIWIPHDKVCFFAKRLNEDESAELFHVLKKNPIKDGGFQIEWVAEKVAERQCYIESRTGNGGGKHKKAYAKHGKTQESISDSDNDNLKKVSKEKKERTTLRKKSTEVDFSIIYNLVPAGWPAEQFAQVFREFWDMRIAKGKPLTENATRRRINQLYDLSGRSYELAEKICLRSTDARWDEFYPMDKSQISKPTQNERREIVRDKA